MTDSDRSRSPAQHISAAIAPPPATWSHGARSMPPPRRAHRSRHSPNRSASSRRAASEHAITAHAPRIGTLQDVSGQRDRWEDSLDHWDTLRQVLGGDEDQTIEASDAGRPRLARSYQTLRSLFRHRVPESPIRETPAMEESEPGRGERERLCASPAAVNESSGIDGGLQTPIPAGQQRHSSPATVTSPLLPRCATTSTPSPSISSFLGNVWPPSPVFIAVLKCSIAYLLASLFTFVPFLARLLTTTYEEDAHGRISRKPAFSAHMVATVVIYFNPAKSAGNMLLADRYCLFLAALSTLVCLASMLTVHLFDRWSPAPGTVGDWVSEMGDWVVCGLWIGGSMGFLAWSKVYVGNPVFNAGCSMAAITIFSVVIKEGNIPKLAEILLIVASGVTCSNLVCFAIFPTSATTRLESSISRSLNRFSTLLDLLTSTFLLQTRNLKGTRTTLREAVEGHAKAFQSLKADLAEAKHERVLDRRIRGRKLKLYDAAVTSLGRLAQHLSSLRSSTKLQESVLRAIKEGKLNADLTMPSEPTDLENEDDEEIAFGLELFLQFREAAGDQMEALVDRCQDALGAIRGLSEKDQATLGDIESIRTALELDLTAFNQSATGAIKQLYAGPERRKEFGHDESFDSEEHQVDGPNEAVFHVYFFLFTLEEFGREMLILLQTVADIMSSESPTTWSFIKSLLVTDRPERIPAPKDPSDLQPPPFPAHDSSASSVLVDATRKPSVWSRLRQPMWRFGTWLSQPTPKYAIKVWIAGAILAVPAYTEWGREPFLEYRGEWALIAFFSTMSPTLGQTNHMSFSRAGGTFIGAFFGMGAYSLFPSSPIILAIVGFLFAMPCFYVITQMPEAMQTGRFTLLGYNLVCLYAYNTRDRGYPVLRIMIFRSITVMVGVLWTAIVSRYWWPYTARRELRIGISDFCLDLSRLYSKLVATYSKGHTPDQTRANHADERTALLAQYKDNVTHAFASVEQFFCMELHLRGQLASLRTLLAQTKNEPRLKGPFPIAFYRDVLLSLERIADKLHSMRCVTTRSEWNDDVRRAFVIPVNKQRREMAGNVILYLYILSAGFRLRTPMPPYFPPAETSRQALLSAIRELDVVKRRSVRGSGRDLLYFAYALAMQDVIAELEYLGGRMQNAFGVISHRSVEEFEALFGEDCTPETLEVELGESGFLFREER